MASNGPDKGHRKTKSSRMRSRSPPADLLGVARTTLVTLFEDKAADFTASNKDQLRSNSDPVRQSNNIQSEFSSTRSPTRVDIFKDYGLGYIDVNYDEKYMVKLEDIDRFQAHVRGIEKRFIDLGDLNSETDQARASRMAEMYLYPVKNTSPGPSHGADYMEKHLATRRLAATWEEEENRLAALRFVEIQNGKQREDKPRYKYT
ncbi:uncharacterized protein RAG0_16593 [Rhynchosporium agropyri]|uniref:Uncharacterized protein n=2 Tax=Rhynchosporium TaxID=38037 RepID=A0A1E1MVM8_RHYSE|nr:uncharacterized protein RAG0_16593 [Rhynchosporium agropyri]CZT53134.1 uncharacterized protein RSE6_14588 [Rhynchosporium secalis]